MTESPPTGTAPDNLPVFTVGEIARAIKGTLEGSFALVRVKGEISGFKQAASGHVYFSLKDADAVLDAVCWRTTAHRLSLKLEDGMEVVAAGRVTTYPGRSKYQLIVETIELAGEGALLKMLEERKRRLAAEGLDAGAPQAVDDARDQRRLGADDDQIDGFALGEADDALDVVGRDREAFGEGRDPGVAGGGIELAAAARLGDGPAQGMFAPPRSYHQNLHPPNPLAAIPAASSIISSAVS